MEKLPGVTYHATGSARNVQWTGLHVAWIVWAMLDAHGNAESWAAQQFCHHDDDQPVYDKPHRILFDDFISEFRPKGRPATENTAKMATGTM